METFAVVVCFLGALIVLFLVFPHKVVEFQGRFYRRAYKTLRRMSDAEIDSMVQLPTDRYFVGRRSEFIHNAPENPRMFTRLILAYRVAGFVLLLFWFICVLAILCYMLAPEYWTTN